jgi:hypothetical protein
VSVVPRLLSTVNGRRAANWLANPEPAA